MMMEGVAKVLSRELQTPHAVPDHHSGGRERERGAREGRGGGGVGVRGSR